MWKYWDWEEIQEKFVKNISKAILLFLSLFLMYNIITKSSFDAIKVFNFTSKRPELIPIYKEIAPLAYPILKKLFLLCLCPVPIILIISWILDTKNTKSGYILYNFSLILFSLVNIGYIFAVIFVMKSTAKWFIFLAIVTIFLIGTLVLNIHYYKKNKDEYSYDIFFKNNILIYIPVILVLCLEVFIIYPKAKDLKISLEENYKEACFSFKCKIYSDIFGIPCDYYNKEFKVHISDQLDTDTASYAILHFINYYNSEGYTFTPEDIIEGCNTLDKYDLSVNSESFNILVKLYDSHKNALKNTSDMGKYNITGNYLNGYYNSSGDAYVDNILRRLEELGYNSSEIHYIQKVGKDVIDEVCEYVYNNFQSGLYEPIKEATIYISEDGNITIADNNQYFIGWAHKEDDYYRVCLYHTVGYYFDENTSIIIEGIDVDHNRYKYISDEYFISDERKGTYSDIIIYTYPKN